MDPLGSCADSPLQASLDGYIFSHFRGELLVLLAEIEGQSGLAQDPFYQPVCQASQELVLDLPGLLPLLCPHHYPLPTFPPGSRPVENLWENFTFILWMGLIVASFGSASGSDINIT